MAMKKLFITLYIALFMLLCTNNNAQIIYPIQKSDGTETEFVPVEDIINVPDTLYIGIPLRLTGTVIPDTATIQWITWMLTNQGGTGSYFADTDSGRMLFSTYEGILTFVAVIYGGVHPCELCDNEEYHTEWECTAEHFEKYFEITVIKPVGIYENNRTEFQVYPNPTNDKFVVELAGIVSIKLYDMLGKEVLTQTASGKTEINISHLPTGVYNISVLSDGKVIRNGKIIKQ